MSIPHFGIGDRATGQGITQDRKRNGMACTVIGGLEFREWRHVDGSLGKSVCYLVRWADGLISVQEPGDLKAPQSPRATGPAWGFVGLNPCGAYA